MKRDLVDTDLCEYRTWAADLDRMLPETGAWMQETLSRETRDAWFEDFFADIDLADALEANKRIVETGIKNYDRERIPAILLKHVQDIRWERNEKARKAEERKRQDEAKKLRRKKQIDSEYVSMASVLKAMQIQSGASGTLSEEQRKAFVAERMPSSDPRSGPRYKCPICCDHGHTVGIAAPLGEKRENAKIMAMACHCPIGAMFKRKWDDNKSFRIRQKLTPEQLRSRADPFGGFNERSE